MGSRRDVLASVINYIGFKKEEMHQEFFKRFLIQKWIYLLQEWKGYNWNYSYNVYLSGPYSPDLSKDVYSLEDSMLSDDDTEANDLPQRFLEDLKEIRDITDDKDLLEALTTLIFIGKRYKDNYIDRKDDINIRFKSVKPLITNEIRDEAWEIIEDKSILSN